MNPKATLHMANGKNIVIELLPEYAPNTVNSFIYAASAGWLDNHAIERIVPGDWIDMSYTAFGNDNCKYLIPNEYALHPEIEVQTPVAGSVCMGGYENGIAGCEFFVPLRDCPELAGKFPVFGKIISGMEEVWRLEKVKTLPVDFPEPQVIINRPVTPEIIERVELELWGVEYEKPVTLKNAKLPFTWKTPAES